MGGNVRIYIKNENFLNGSFIPKFQCSALSLSLFFMSLHINIGMLYEDKKCLLKAILED